MNKKALYFVIPAAAIAVIGLCIALVYGIRGLSSGETRLVAQVITDDVINEVLLNDASRIGYELHAKGISGASSRKENDTVKIDGIDSEHDSAAHSIILEFINKKYAVNQTESGGISSYSLRLLPEYDRHLRQDAVKMSAETINRRLHELFSGLFYRTRVSVDTAVGGDSSDRLIVEIPATDHADRIISIIVNKAMLSLCPVKKEGEGPFASVEEAAQASGGTIPEEYQVLPYREGTEMSQYMAISKWVVISGKDIKTARRSTDASGAAAVSFFLTADGAARFSDFTEKHIGERLAIVLDNVVYAAPRINSRIEGEGIIQGHFTEQQAEDLALLLRSGALPASIRVLDQRNIR